MRLRALASFSARSAAPAVLGVCLGLTLATASAAPAAPRAAVPAAAEYTGPFVTVQHVPAVCITSVANTRYYNDSAGPGTVELRTGGHGHGGHLKCIYYFFDGPPQYTGDHVYGKWLILPGTGVPIPQPDGLVIDVQNCFSPPGPGHLPYSFPVPNDCGEDWLTRDGQAWHYGHTGAPMFPAVTP